MKIVIFTSITGHKSLAEAAKSFLENLPGVEIKIIDLMNDKFWNLYKFSYRFAPFFTKIPFELSKNEIICEMVKNYFITKYRKKILDVLSKEKPDVVITTYFGYIPILDEIKDISNFYFINLISDPVTIHPLLFSIKADYNIGFGKYCLKVGKRLGLKNILPAGWLVRKKFFEEVEKEKILKKYGLKDIFTILVCGGSEGSNSIFMLLPILFFSNFSRDFQVIFICGNNETLKRVILQTYRFAKKFNRSLPKIIVKGFTDNLNEFMAISNVVIGKAGPNLIFESVSMLKPFIAITHISGQEDGNLELIKELKFGWVAEDPISAKRVIEDLIKNPNKLEKFKRNLSKYRKINFDTGLKLSEIVKCYSNVKT